MAKRPAGSLDRISISKTDPVIPHRDSIPTDNEGVEKPKADVVTPNKALTLKLTEDEYERLRLYAFSTKRSHQSVLRQAVLEMLDKKNA